jgi:hypothetical protein
MALFKRKPSIWENLAQSITKMVETQPNVNRVLTERVEAVCTELAIGSIIQIMGIRNVSFDEACKQFLDMRLSYHNAAVAWNKEYQIKQKDEKSNGVV